MNNPETVMQDDTLRALDRDISDLRVSNAKLSTSVDNLTEKVDQLTELVGNLNNIIQRGKGALWVVALFAGAIGAGVTTLVKKVTG